MIRSRDSTWIGEDFVQTDEVIFSGFPLYNTLYLAFLLRDSGQDKLIGRNVKHSF